MKQQFVDDVFDKLDSDISRIRKRHRQYISYSNEAGAKSVVDEILDNAFDECRNPKSPGNTVHITFDELSGFIDVEDNGRGIPSSILEEVYTTLNMGSNINTSNKADLKAEILGQNGTGTLAICGLAERAEITSYRGGTENIFRKIIFEEGVKVSDESGKCSEKQHGMHVRYKPSKVMGKNTRIVWADIAKELENFQYLNKKKIKIDSRYIDKKGKETFIEYKVSPFNHILNYNDTDKFISNKFLITIDDSNVIEELDGENIKRYISMDIAFAYTSSLNPYIDSFSNSNNTVDNGDHLDGAMEAICRYFQMAVKNSLTEKEKTTLDIKWEDIKTGLSLVVALRTNFERLYTGQTKHKVVSSDIRKIIVVLTVNALNEYFTKNPGQLKDLINIIKTNARARREGDKLRNAVVKNNLSNWSSYKMKNFDPCTRKGLKEYKELFIIEGDSAKGSLKLARDPAFQALFAIRGVSANVFKLTLDQIIGPKGNKEFTDMVTVLGCNAGIKFDINKLQYSKIILATDADIDALFIRSLLLAFFFKVFPEIIQAGILYIAEPPLYRVDDKNNPFVINNQDYISRYATNASKDYKVGYLINEDDVEFLNKENLINFLSDTSSYVEKMLLLSEHYKVNDRLLEMIFEEFAMIYKLNPTAPTSLKVNICLKNIQHLMDYIGTEFPELYYDDSDHVIKGSINGKYQLIEISESMIKRSSDVIDMIIEHGPKFGEPIILVSNKTSAEHRLSMLGVLKILNKYQPTIVHRFKGLGENDAEDIKTTVMDPNTRILIKVTIQDIENDMKIFQLLRGGSPLDAQARKQMMKEYKIPRELIDT